MDTPFRPNARANSDLASGPLRKVVTMRFSSDRPSDSGRDSGRDSAGIDLAGRFSGTQPGRGGARAMATPSRVEGADLACRNNALFL